jgi:hypothetical protein
MQRALRTLRFTALLIALFGSVSVSTAQSDDDTPVPTKSGCTAKALGRHPDPRLLVACFYLPFVDASFMDEDYKSLKLLTAFASRDLKGRLRRESECQIRIGGICSLDYNMFIWGQDFENVRILDTRFDPTRKIVTIRIENFGNTKPIDYYFVTENGTLRIDNIVYHLIGRDESLKDFLK